MKSNRTVNEVEKGLSSTSQQIGPFYHLPILTPISIYTPSYRKTHSDVMCISNSAIIHDRKVNEKKKSLSPYCNLPYEESRIRKKAETRKKYQTALEKKQNERSREKMNKELHTEHRIFMENLRKERELQMNRESAAAITIQRYMMGFSVRRSKLNIALAPFRMNEEEIMNTLIESTNKIGLDINLENEFNV